MIVVLGLLRKKTDRGKREGGRLDQAMPGPSPPRVTTGTPGSNREAIPGTEIRRHLTGGGGNRSTVLMALTSRRRWINFIKKGKGKPKKKTDRMLVAHQTVTWEVPVVDSIQKENQPSKKKKKEERFKRDGTRKRYVVCGEQRKTSQKTVKVRGPFLLGGGKTDSALG